MNTVSFRKVFFGLALTAALAAAGCAAQGSGDEVSAPKVTSLSVSAADYPDEAAVTVNPRGGQEIAADIPYHWDLAALSVRFAVTPAGAVITPDPNGVIDYSEPVLFSITADALKSVYTVTLRLAPSQGFYIEPNRRAEDGIGSFAEALTWLEAEAQDDGGYLYAFGADDTAANIVLGSQTLNGAAGVTLTLEGSGVERKLRLPASGSAEHSLFLVQDGAALRLQKNMTLEGRRTGSNAALVTVNGGALELYDGAKISGHTNTNAVTQNSPNNAGGVLVDGGSFHIYGGEISGNHGIYGGGVKIYNGTIAMEGGLIINNKATGGGGGGISFVGGTSTISGGIIRGNSATKEAGQKGTGGGIQISSGGSVTMTGGLITGNDASGINDSGGGGVRMYGGSFNLAGGVIENNTTESETDPTAFNLHKTGGNLNTASYPNQDLLTEANGFIF